MPTARSGCAPTSTASWTSPADRGRGRSRALVVEAAAQQDVREALAERDPPPEDVHERALAAALAAFDAAPCVTDGRIADPAG